jgi:hypothetical protein
VSSILPVRQKTKRKSLRRGAGPLVKMPRKGKHQPGYGDLDDYDDGLDDYDGYDYYGEEDEEGGGGEEVGEYRRSSASSARPPGQF